MKRRLYHRILAVALTAAVAMTSLPAVAMEEMTGDVNEVMSSAQMNDIPQEVAPNEGVSNTFENEDASSQASNASEDTQSESPAESAPAEQAIPATEQAQPEMVETEDVPIGSAQDLQDINNNLSGTYYLTQDIDLTGVSFTPIGSKGAPFTGTFDGNGYKVTNLKLENSGAYDQGLFGYVGSSGIVKNVGVTGSVSGNDDVSGIVGELNGGTIENCYSEATVTGNACVGGVVGKMFQGGNVSNCYNTGVVSGSSIGHIGGVAGEVSKDGSVSNCYNTGKVFGSTHVGGVAGYVYGSLNTCYNTGAVLGSGTSFDAITGFIFAAVGGVAGSVKESGSMSNCYNTGAVTGSVHVVGVVGDVGYKASVSNCYYNTDNAGNATKAVGYGTAGENVSGLTTAQMSGSDALNQMKFTDPDAWVTLANAQNDDGSVTTYYYPQLKVFVADPTNPQPEEMLIAPILISTADELQAINNNLSGYFILKNDINLSKFAFEPIGRDGNPFTGIFDGNGHKVTNLAIENSQASYQGLFGYVGSSGIVKNVGVTGSVSGKGDVGGIVGCLSGGTIKNCYSRVRVRGNSGYVGGVVGTMDGNMENCYSGATVTGGSDVGGVAGSVVSGSVSNCYNTGVVTGSADVGGVAGSVVSGSVSNCYNIRTVTGTDRDRVGGVAGYVSGGSVSNCYYNRSDAGNAKKAVGFGTAGENVSGLTTAQMSGSDALNQMKFTDPTAWVTLENEKNSNGTVRTYYHPQLKVFVDSPKYPEKWEMPSTAGVASTTILVSTADELQAINNNLSGNYILGNDIDLSGFAFTPIGGLANPFTGTFDGNGYKVTNLKLENSGAYDQGLFGYVGSSGTVKNLGVTGSVSGKGDVGGLVGYLSGGTIKNCYSEVMVQGDSGYVGGLVGTMNGNLKNCYNTGVVTGNTFVGGLAGYVTGSVSDCYNTGEVFGSSHVGGVAGLISGNVIDCYNTGAVTGNDAYTGGVAGSVMGGNVSNCYYNKNNAGNAKKAVGYGTAGANVAGLTTAQMSGSDALNWMKFTDLDAWVALANARNSNGTVKTYYYPQLSVFVDDWQTSQPEEMPSTAGAAATAARRCRASTIVWM